MGTRRDSRRLGVGHPDGQSGRARGDPLPDPADRCRLRAVRAGDGKGVSTTERRDSDRLDGCALRFRAAIGRRLAPPDPVLGGCHRVHHAQRHRLGPRFHLRRLAVGVGDLLSGLAGHGDVLRALRLLDGEGVLPREVRARSSGRGSLPQ